jgi:hypothetical protein
MGRPPFMPATLEAPVQQKRPAKTAGSPVVPSRVPGQAMGLEVLRAPVLNARQFLALRVELRLGPAPRAETLRRYEVPTETAFRALENQWREPRRRGELESALAELAAVARGGCWGRGIGMTGGPGAPAAVGRIPGHFGLRTHRRRSSARRTGWSLSVTPPCTPSPWCHAPAAVS